MFQSRTHEVNGQRIHALHAGPDDGPLMLLLHGFPEFSHAWSAVAPHFADTHRVVMPDQRGCGRSSRPEGVESYRPRLLAADMIALVESLAPLGGTVTLCGHDWGASVAYAMTFHRPDLVARLVVANGAHPVTFQRALLAIGAQTRASRYIDTLRRPDAAERMSEDGFRRTFSMLSKFSTVSWLDDETRALYRDVWREALPTMLHWYRATPLEVPPEGAAARAVPFTVEALERFRVRCPHLVVWGMRDTALLPEAREGLEAFCADLTVHEIADASHWLLHERPGEVAAAMDAWLAEERPTVS